MTVQDQAPAGPCSAGALMTEDEAAWVRAHAWTGAMRKTDRDVPRFYRACLCQDTLTSLCRHEWHDRCPRGTPLAMPVSLVATHGGRVTYHRDRDTGALEPHRHPTPTATGPERTALAQVWLADRLCRWLCECDCHTAPPEPVQLTLI